jgi:hypothetical protein
MHALCSLVILSAALPLNKQVQQHCQTWTRGFKFLGVGAPLATWQVAHVLALGQVPAGSVASSSPNSSVTPALQCNATQGI